VLLQKEKSQWFPIYPNDQKSKIKAKLQSVIKRACKSKNRKVTNDVSTKVIWYLRLSHQSSSDAHEDIELAALERGLEKSFKHCQRGKIFLIDILSLNLLIWKGNIPLNVTDSIIVEKNEECKSRLVMSKASHVISERKIIGSKRSRDHYWKAKGNISP